MKNVPGPLSNLHIRFTFQSLSPVVNPFIWDFSYFTTFTTQDISDVSDLCNHIVTSFSAVPTGGTNAPSHYWSGILNGGANASMIDVYDVTNHLDGSKAGSPVLVSSFTANLGIAGGVVPEGDSVVITMQAPYGTDVEFAPGMRPRARDRGRLYFGPVSANAYTPEGVTNRCLITTTCRGDLTKWIKAINVYTSSPHTVVWNLGVWSRKNAAMKSLQEVWIDDRPDYTRRRAGKAATKTVLGLP
jgi:hypothetical protein